MKTYIQISRQGLRLSGSAASSAASRYCFMLTQLSWTLCSTPLRGIRTFKQFSFLQKNTKTICKVLILALLFLANGCAKFNDSRVAGLFSSEQNLIHVAYKIAEDLQKQAFPPLQPRHPEQPILTTTFVNNNDLSQTSHFSRVLQEHLTSRFVQMGYTVREVKFRNELNVVPLSGENMLSRNLQDIRSSQTAQAISVGTYSLADKTIYLSARLIDPVNANIISSVDYKLVLDKNMQAMFGLQPRKHELIDPIDEPRHSLMTRLLY